MDLDAVAMRGIADLTVALERECRLMDDLHRAVLQQRDAVADNDAPNVESSIRLAGRTLLTLQETRRHRAALLQRLVGDPAQPLADLERRFEAPLPETLLAVRRRVQHTATEVAEAVWHNQEMLLGAVREREALLLELLTGVRPTTPAAPPGATPEG